MAASQTPAGFDRICLHAADHDVAEKMSYHGIIEYKNGIGAFYPKTRDQWRDWLQHNCQSEKSVWLIIYHKKSTTASMNYQEAVEEALCFGWIDCRANKRNKESYYLYFTHRKLKSNWSKPNIERVARMTEQGLMTPQGQQHIDHAKSTGKWYANQK